jgi:predicted Zn-dependent peptidase
MTPNTHTLSNGVRIIHQTSPTDVAYCGIAIDAGTRDEQEQEYGMAHFCEHMMFKGTKKRRAWHIINRMETVGGDLNAYTNKEETVVYAAFVKEHFERATELICDVVFNSTFPQNEMEKEAEVIIDEIESYNDSPAELIFDRFENLIFSNHPLGHDILGDAERIRQYTPEDAFRFTKRLYRPDKMVFFVYGNIDFKKIIRTAEKHFCAAVAPSTDEATDEKTIEDKASVKVPTTHMAIEHRSTHQAHVMIGCKAFPSKDKRRIALYFLNNIIGGPGMNSRLNIALREHHGLVYNVESSLTNYTDTGTFAIYFGCDPKDVERCKRIVRKELNLLMDNPLSERQIKAYIKQISGQIRVACDNRESYALDMAKSYLHYNKFEGIEDTIALLEELTPQFIQEVAAEVFREDNLTTIEFLP